MTSLAINVLVAVGFLVVMKWQNKLGGLLASPPKKPLPFLLTGTNSHYTCMLLSMV